MGRSDRITTVLADLWNFIEESTIDAGAVLCIYMIVKGVSCLVR
jgi:hypothetical protein